MRYLYLQMFRKTEAESLIMLQNTNCLYLDIKLNNDHNVSTDVLWFLLIDQNDEEGNLQATGKHSSSAAHIQEFCLLQIPEYLKEGNECLDEK